MVYEIFLDEKVIKFLETLPNEIATRIKDKLRILTENPFHYLEHYEGDDFYKFRIGEYRALIDIDFRTKEIFVTHLDHRGRIYKRRNK